MERRDTRTLQVWGMKTQKSPYAIPCRNLHSIHIYIYTHWHTYVYSCIFRRRRERKNQKKISFYKFQGASPISTWLVGALQRSTTALHGLLCSATSPSLTFYLSSSNRPPISPLFTPVATRLLFLLLYTTSTVLAVLSPMTFKILFSIFFQFSEVVDMSSKHMVSLFIVIREFFF